MLIKLIRKFNKLSRKILINVENVKNFKTTKKILKDTGKR